MADRELTRDLSEILAGFEGQLATLVQGNAGGRVAYHPPCTLQHGQQIRGKVESVLRTLGVDVVLCADNHLCCGSAGAYALLHPDIAQELRARKLATLTATGADEIVSANIGCIAHLQAGAATRSNTGSNWSSAG